MTKHIATIAALTLLACGAARGAAAQEIQTLRVQGNVYMLAGPGGNTVVQVGDTGVLVVDTQTPAVSDKLLAAIRAISSKAIHYIVNTSVEAEHIGGNAALAKAGPTRPNAAPVQAGLGGNVEGKTTVLAHETVLNRMIANKQIAPEGWPTETFLHFVIRDRKIDDAVQRGDDAIGAAALLRVDERIARRREDVACRDDVGPPEEPDGVAVGLRGPLVEDLNAFAVEEDLLDVAERKAAR